MNEENIENGLPLSNEDKIWLERMKNLTTDSIKSVEEAAKQLIAMITVMQGIYAAVLAFSGIKRIPEDNLIAALFYALPIVLWLLSLFFALNVFKSRKYQHYSNSPDSCKETFNKIANYKYRHLNLSYACFVLSFLVAIAGIMYWLYTGAQPEPPRMVL